MPLFLVDASALAYWQHYRCRMASDLRFPLDAPPLALAGVPTSPPVGAAPLDAQIEADRASDPILAALPLPLHLAVSTPAARRASSYKHCHTMARPLPEAFVQVSPDVFVQAPPHLCAELARHLPLVPFLCLLYSLTGHYVSHDNAPLTPVAPLTSVDDLRRFAVAHPRTPGMKPLLAALPFVADNSASPMETALALLLCLPCAQGGFGLPLPVLNRPVAVDARQGLSVGQQTYRCDLLWPEPGLAIEYDGEQYHTGTFRIAHDVGRRNDLAYLGITVLVATKRQLFDARAFHGLALQVAHHLRARLRHTQTRYDWGERNAALRSTLLYGNAPGTLPSIIS